MTVIHRPELNGRFAFEFWTTDQEISGEDNETIAGYSLITQDIISKSRQNFALLD